MAITQALGFGGHNWIDSKYSNGLVTRGAYLLHTPVVAVSPTLDTILGLGYAVSAFIKCGSNHETYSRAMDQLISSRLIIALPFANLLKVINPRAKVVSNQHPSEFKDHGFLYTKTSDKLRELADTLSQKNGKSSRFLSRLCALAFLVTAVASRILDTVLGSIGALLAILSCGNIPHLNQFAYKNLEAPGIIADLFFGITHLFNPDAGKLQYVGTSQEKSNYRASRTFKSG